MSVIRRRGVTDEQDSRLRPKSFHYDTNTGGLSKSLSAIHSIFNPLSQEETVVNGDKGSISPPEALTDPSTPRGQRKSSFKSRFLRSKTDGNLYDKKPTKSDSAKPFKSRFLKKDPVETGSPLEGRKTFRSKYLNKKYNDQLKRIEQYASARNLDRAGSQDEQSYSWKAYLENKAHRSQAKRQEITSEQGKSTLSPRSERRYNFSRKVYKSTEEADYSIASPKGRKKSDAGLAVDGFRRSDHYSPGGYLASRQKGDSAGGSRQSKYSGYGEKRSPGSEFSTSGIEYNADVSKLGESAYSSSWYLRPRRSAIADLANDFRSPRSETLHVSQNPSSPGSIVDDITGRVSPAGERSARRPSTIIRRPRNQFSPRDHSWSRESSDTHSRSSQLDLENNYADTDRSTTRKYTSDFHEKRIRPKSMYLPSSGADEDLVSNEENGITGRVRSNSLFLGTGVSTPDLTKSDEGAESKEKEENRRKAMEEARRQWRKERAQTVDVELEEPTIVETKSLLDSEVVLRKPKPSYPTDDGQLLISTEPKPESQSEEISRVANTAKEASLEKGETSTRKGRAERGIQESTSIYDQISDVKEKVSSAKDNQTGTTTSPESQSLLKQESKKGNEGLRDSVNGGTNEIAIDGGEAQPKEGEPTKKDSTRKKSTSVIRRKLESAEAKKARARVNSMYGSLLDIDADQEEEYGTDGTGEPRKIGHESSSKARARPSSMYFDENDQIDEEDSTALTKKTDSENVSGSKTKENAIHEIPLIVHRGASESTDEEQLSPLQRAFSIEATLPRKSIQETSTSTVKPLLKDSSTQTTESPPRVQRARPRSLFFPPDDDDKTEETIFVKGYQGDESISDTKSITSNVRQHDTAQDARSFRSFSGKDDSYRNLSSSYSYRSERLRTRKTKGRSGRRIFCGDSDSSDDDVPRYVPIRTIDISGLLSDDEESKPVRSIEPEKTDIIKTKSEPVKVDMTNTEAERTDSAATKQRKDDHSRVESVKTGSIKSESPRLESLKSTSNQSPNSAISSSLVDKPLTPRTEYRSEYLRRRRQKYLEIEDETPKYVPIRTIDLSDLLESSDEEKKKKKAEEKAREAEELAIIEKRRELRKSRSKLDLTDKLSSDEDRRRSPKIADDKLKVDNLVVLRSSRRTEATLRPKSMHLATSYSIANDDYKADKAQAISDSFQADLNSFRKEINRLLYKTSDFKDRSKNTQPKAAITNKSYKETRVCDIRGDSINVNHVVQGVDERLAMNELFDYPSTEDEWRQFVNDGVLIRKSVERIERQKYQTYHPFYYSDSDSSDESVGDLYELASGISYARARRSFNSSYIGSEIAHRKVTSGESSRDKPYGRYTRLGADDNSHTNRYSSDVMSYSPETAL